MIHQATNEIPDEVPRFERVDYSDILAPLAPPFNWAFNTTLGGPVPQRGSSYDPQPKRDYAALRAEMQRQGVIKLSKLFTKEQCSLLSEHFAANSSKHVNTAARDGVQRNSIHNVQLTRYLHELLGPVVTRLVGEPVKPSYTFSSSYFKGSGLFKHYDSRPACTWNISLVVDASHPVAAINWPLFVQSRNKVHQIHLAVGDAAIYSGTGDLHWRDKMPSYLDWVFGVFFHFAPAAYTGSLD